ncbi:DUF1491 family protein [Roseospira visakhapatnamensis]|uniref:DUF1491 family protein n=1 Tax=Roseospira visakhapatnamensis TaxID=390880 RepID=A0A7W6RGC3_9PROT|nr:DUF1491 family protein [Roseospira visakhapatnamensis]MBB4268061.1 hypothetical protein [Roseospira visakhapatnamensis]
MARLTAGLRARAYLRQVQARGGFGAVLRRGDETAGDILLKVRPVGAPARVDVYAQATLADGQRGWMRLGQPGFADEAAADAAIARAVTRDPDIWVLELEPDEAGFPLDEPLVLDQCDRGGQAERP